MLSCVIYICIYIYIKRIVCSHVYQYVHYVAACVASNMRLLQRQRRNTRDQVIKNDVEKKRPSISYTLGREYRVAENRYLRLLFTCEDRLCANLRVYGQSMNKSTSLSPDVTGQLWWRHDTSQKRPSLAAMTKWTIDDYFQYICVFRSWNSM